MCCIKRIVIGVVLVWCTALMGQSTIQVDSSVFSYQEFLGLVKTQHPLIKQANLTLSMGEANLLKARGGFDPKIELDYDRKKFKKKEYYDQLYTVLKVPTWYGIEFKASFEENTGEFLDPSLTVPEDGLYSAGISFSLAKGLVINERMATLKQARYFLEQSKADRDLLINKVLFEATNAYFDWLKASNEQQIYSSFLNNARLRLEAVKRSVEEGDIAEIDITEARIALNNRKLDLEAAMLKKRKAALKVSNYLWFNNLPLEIQSNALPSTPSENILNTSLQLNRDEAIELLLAQHPKLESLDAKIGSLEVERSLKRNNLLPQVDLQYNFLSQEYDQINTFNTANYKAFATIRFPLFLRKERGDLKLASLKLQETEFEKQATVLQIQTKIEAVRAEITSLTNQNIMVDELVADYQDLVIAEQRKFSLGESSLFLINTREQKLIDAQLKENELLVKKLRAMAKLFNIKGQAVPL